MFNSRSSKFFISFINNITFFLQFFSLFILSVSILIDNLKSDYFCNYFLISYLVQII